MAKNRILLNPFVKPLTNFWQYRRIPENEKMCDQLSVNSIRTVEFIKENIFGGQELDESETDNTSHVYLLMGQDVNFYLVNDDGSFLVYKDFCPKF